MGRGVETDVDSFAASLDLLLAQQGQGVQSVKAEWNLARRGELIDGSV